MRITSHSRALALAAGRLRLNDARARISVVAALQRSLLVQGRPSAHSNMIDDAHRRGREGADERPDQLARQAEPVKQQGQTHADGNSGHGSDADVGPVEILHGRQFERSPEICQGPMQIVEQDYCAALESRTSVEFIAGYHGTIYCSSRREILGAAFGDCGRRREKPHWASAAGRSYHEAAYYFSKLERSPGGCQFKSGPQGGSHEGDHFLSQTLQNQPPPSWPDSIWSCGKKQSTDPVRKAFRRFYGMARRAQFHAPSPAAAAELVIH